MYPLLVLGSLICINSGFGLTVVGFSSNLGSFMSGISTIKGGEYVQATGVVTRHKRLLVDKRLLPSILRRRVLDWYHFYLNHTGGTMIKNKIQNV